MRRILIAIAIAASLLTSGAQTGFLGPLWELVSSVWSDSDSEPIPPPQADEGCGMDPLGCPRGS
jgi:hypothetical protein